MQIHTSCLVIGQNLTSSIQSADGTTVQLSRLKKIGPILFSGACEKILKIKHSVIILVQDPKNPEPLKDCYDLNRIPTIKITSGEPIIVEDFHEVMFMEISENPNGCDVGDFIFLERQQLTGEEWFADCGYPL